MSQDQTPPPIGTVGWIDLTIPDADRVRDFYASVLGWTPEPLDMGGYADYVMKAGERAVAGVCHARGVNAGVPGAWLLYFMVADLDAALAQVHAGGGKRVGEVRSMGSARMAIIQDPSGAVCALYQA